MLKLNRLKFLIWLYNRRKARTFQIPEGGHAIILPDTQSLMKIIDGLADADNWTDQNYSAVLTNHTTQILNN